MLVGIHGTLRLHSWLLGTYSDGLFEEDVFSLAVQRTIAYGFSSLAGHDSRPARWYHNDAGGDWRQDGLVRELAWLQVAVADDDPPMWRIPVQPAVVVVRDALARVGEVNLTGLHAVVPMSVAPDGRFDLASVSGWFGLADPTVEQEFYVTIVGSARTGLADLANEILPVARHLAAQLTIELVGASAVAGSSLPAALTGHAQGFSSGLYFRCRAHEWSFDLLTWVTEVFVEAMRAADVKSDVRVTVSLDQPRFG